ncbi:Spore coat protein F precursor [compost metagenome]
MRYALHEVLEVHEITAFKTICLTKAKTMQMLVSDPQLKSLMQLDAERSTNHLQELSSILRKAKEQELQYEPHH